MTKLLVQDKKMDAYVRRHVVRVFREIMSDPDWGLELRPEFVRRLKKSIRDAKLGKLIPFEKIKEKYS